MAHEIFNNSAMAYAGDVPWHGLGVKLPRNATWEEIKSILPFYTVQERALYAVGVKTAIPDRKALVASNDGRYLATVGADYGVVQFDDLAEAVMRAVGTEAVFHTAGLLGADGARGWLLGEIPNPIKVDGDPSEIRKYFLAYAGHDGSTPVSLVNCATRVVCRNTVGAALGERNGARWTIRHTSKAADRVKAAGEAFGRMIKGYERFGELAAILSKVRFTAEQTTKILSDTIPLDADASDAQRAKVESQRGEIRQLAEYGTGVVSTMRGTAWGLLQGITEWADHKRPTRGVLTAGERFDSQIFGRAAEVKRAGMAAILSRTP